MEQMDPRIPNHDMSPQGGPNFLEGFISEQEYAVCRGVSLRTCQRDRQLRDAPPYVLIGRKIYYRIEAVREWLLARERSLCRQPGPQRGIKCRPDRAMKRQITAVNRRLP